MNDTFASSNLNNMIFRNYPVIRILIPYIIGIILAYVFSPRVSFPWLIAICFALVAFSFLFKEEKKYSIHWLSGLSIQICFLIFGLFLTLLHYENKLSEQNFVTLEKDRFWQVLVIDHPVEKPKSYKATILIQNNLKGETINKKALVYFGKDSLHIPKYGDILFVHSQLKEFNNVNNPYSFDYKKFMNRKGIFYTSYIPANNWQKINHINTNPIINLAYNIQQYFSGIFSRTGLEGAEYSVITAILLGNDETMDPSLKASYSAAGVSHILCVSGMHVGIIFMIFDFLLRPLDYSKPGRITKTTFMMFLIWAYACITGLSPSVRRAASMFTFVTIGNLLRRNTNIFHSLYASLFILLIINPLLVFDVGFQLSYLAVFGIVIFQKPIYELWKVKNKILSYFWNLMSVSIAAQLTTFPISIFYFGQFPNYFLLANLSVISLSFVVVVSGVILLCTSFIPYISSAVTWVLTHEIKLMNLIITSIEKLPGAVTENICISMLQMVLIYSLIVFFFLFFQLKMKKYYWLGLLTLLCVIVMFDIDKYSSQHIVNHTTYNLQKGSAISFNYHGKVIIFADSIKDKKHQDYSYSIQNHIRKMRAESVIVPLDTPFYEGNFITKKDDFIIFNDEIYILMKKKRKALPNQANNFVSLSLY